MFFMCLDGYSESRSMRKLGHFLETIIGLSAEMILIALALFVAAVNALLNG